MIRPDSNPSAAERAARLPWPLLAMVSNRRIYAGHAPERDGDGECAALVAAAAAAARAGVNLVQVRERGLEDASLLALVGRVRAAVAGSGARVLVNDRIDVALAAAVAGVHLPGRAVACSRVRAIVPEGFLIGRSVHTVDEAVSAAAGGGCDYLMFGSVFESNSKPPGHPVAGIGALARVCASVPLPVLAVGGITLSRVPDVAQAGAAGVAAIGLFATGAEPELRQTVNEICIAFRQAR
jgi:thiamine-phosphate pyrophosphorylase